MAVSQASPTEKAMRPRSFPLILAASAALLMVSTRALAVTDDKSASELKAQASLFKITKSVGGILMGAGIGIVMAPFRHIKLGVSELVDDLSKPDISGALGQIRRREVDAGDVMTHLRRQLDRQRSASGGTKATLGTHPKSESHGRQPPSSGRPHGAGFRWRDHVRGRGGNLQHGSLHQPAKGRFGGVKRFFAKFRARGKGL